MSTGPDQAADEDFAVEEIAKKADKSRVQGIGRVKAATVALFRGMTDKKARKEDVKLVRPGNATTIEPDIIGWAYEPWLTTEGVGYVHGEGGSGKSTILLWFAAQLSQGLAKGEWYGIKKHTVVLLPEDAQHVVRKRFELMGGDPEYLHVWSTAAGADGEQEYGLDLYTESRFTQIFQWLQEDDFGLLIVDDQEKALAIDNSNSRNDVYANMLPLAALSRDLHISTQVVGHNNKEDTADSVRKAAGSKAYRDSSRTMYHVIKDIDEPGRFVYWCVAKNSFENAYSLPALKFEYHEEVYEVPKMKSDGTVVMRETKVGYVTLVEETQENAMDLAARMLREWARKEKGATTITASNRPRTTRDFLAIVLVRAAADGTKLKNAEISEQIEALRGSKVSDVGIRKAREELKCSTDGKNPATYWLEGDALELAKTMVSKLDTGEQPAFSQLLDGTPFPM